MKTAHEHSDFLNMIENQSFEWKESWRDEYLKWISGFANAGGGTLVIGKNNKGVAVGVNPEIANAFFRAGEIESWGPGIERMLAACQDAQCPAPIIDYAPGDFWLKFPFAPAHVAEPITELGSRKTPVKTPVKILQLLEEQPELSLAELAVLIGKSASAIERASTKLVKAGKLRRIAPPKGGRWEVGAKSEG
jgi:predicted HTH transcriptional regulator